METSFPILLVDDDVVSRTVVEKHLRKAGLEVVSVSNGKEALARLEETFYPIVLTDWMMPGISGPELCQLIREKKTERYVFIILITSRDSKTDIVSGLESGADDYLAKPIHSAELVARINTGIRILKLEQSLKSANEEIRLLSITDALTGCFNRAYLGERFPSELTRAQRYHHALSVVLADIDHFKKVNDRYGHQAGDLVLENFARCVTAQIREQVDWIVRYGGEEFLIVLPETDRAGLAVVSERLRQSVACMQIAHEGKVIPITASFGGATVSFSPDVRQNISMEELINRADEQLYCSKNNGRDCVNIIELQDSKKDTCSFSASP